MKYFIRKKCKSPYLYRCPCKHPLIENVMKQKGAEALHFPCVFQETHPGWQSVSMVFFSRAKIKNLMHHFMSSYTISLTLYNRNRYRGLFFWLDDGLLSVTVGVCEDVIRRAFEIMSVN